MTVSVKGLREASQAPGIWHWQAFIMPRVMKRTDWGSVFWSTIAFWAWSGGTNYGISLEEENLLTVRALRQGQTLAPKNPRGLTGAAIWGHLPSPGSSLPQIHSDLSCFFPMDAENPGQFEVNKGETRHCLILEKLSCEILNLLEKA